MKKGTVKRIAAIIGIIAILACVIVTLVFAITGNANFLGMLLVTLMMPILLWVYMFIYKLIKDKSNEA